jgi:hypothetical protein
MSGNLKRWEKKNENTFVFLVDEAQVADLTFDLKTYNAVLKTQNEEYFFTRKGFWKTSLEILDNKEVQIAKLYFEKWYSHMSTLEYKNQKLYCATRNNPMIEVALLDNKKTVLAYGLQLENGVIHLNISSAQQTIDPILEALIWFAFIPIATENIIYNNYNFKNTYLQF